MVTPFILHNSAVDENDVQKKPDAVPQSSSLLIPYNEINPSDIIHIFDTFTKEDVLLVGVENSDADVFIVTSENSIENINNGGTDDFRAENHSDFIPLVAIQSTELAP